MRTQLVTDYGQIVPVQTVGDSYFDLKKFATRRVDPAAETVASQHAQLNDQMSKGYGEHSSGLGFGSSVDTVAKANPYEAYTIDQGALDNEATLLKMYQQEALLKQKEGSFYDNLANGYGNISADGSTDFSNVPSDSSSLLRQIAKVESGGKNITTPNKSGYVGIYQQRYRDGDIGSAWAKKHGYTPRQILENPKLQNQMMLDQIAGYKKQFGSKIPVNNYTLFMAHNMGVGGTRAILSGRLTNTIRRNIRNQGVNGKSDYELIQGYHKKFRPRFA